MMLPGKDSDITNSALFDDNLNSVVGNGLNAANDENRSESQGSLNNSDDFNE